MSWAMSQRKCKVFFISRPLRYNLLKAAKKPPSIKKVAFYRIHSFLFNRTLEKILPSRSLLLLNLP